jgi:hypothetical protein
MYLAASLRDIANYIENVLKLTGLLNLLVWKGIGKPSEKEMKKKQ